MTGPDLVHDVEGRGPRPEDRDEERHRGQRPLPAAQQAYANIAGRLLGRDIPLLELDAGASWRFLAPIKRFFGLS